MSTHTITAQIAVKFRSAGSDDIEVAYPTLEMEYRYNPGSPEVRYQNNGDPGWPAESAEVELLSAKLISDDGLLPLPSQVKEWAEEWLWEEGYDKACDNAESDRAPDPDEYYDSMRDEPPNYLTGDEDDY